MSKMSELDIDIREKLAESKSKLEEAKSKQRELYNQLNDTKYLVQTLEFNVRLYEAILDTAI